MMEISVGTGILASVVFLAFIGLSIATLIMWVRDIEGCGIELSTLLFMALTVGVAIFLAIIIGIVPANLGIFGS